MEIFKDEKIKKIIKKLQDAIKLTHFEGHVFIVGGAIRNALLKEPIKDIDVCVEYKNGGFMLANLLAARERCYVTNKNPVIYETFGTAKVNLFKDEDIKDIDIEFVQTIKGTNTLANGFASQVYGTVEEDSKRRDLTINSLYYNISDGKLYDYNCGIDDLTTQTLRTPNNPDVIFQENPIRMLRTIRFSAQLGWGIEKETWLGIIRNSHLIKKASQELITSEIIKIITSPNPSMGIRKLMYCGLLNRIMPDVYDMNSAYESKNPMVTTFDHTMRVLDMTQPFVENRLAALFHDVGKIVTNNDRTISPEMFSADVAESDLKAMKLSNAVVSTVKTAIRYHRLFKIYADGVLPPDKKIRKFINLCGDDIGVTIDLMNANNLHSTYDKKKRQALDIVNRIEELEKVEKNKNIKLPINGTDIIKEFNLKSSPAIGLLMEVVKDAYFENPKITKDECFKLVHEKLLSLTV